MSARRPLEGYRWSHADCRVNFLSHRFGTASRMRFKQTDLLLRDASKKSARFIAPGIGRHVSLLQSLWPRTVGPRSSFLVLSNRRRASAESQQELENVQTFQLSKQAESARDDLGCDPDTGHKSRIDAGCSLVDR
jgi:hypothetical protein